MKSLPLKFDGALLAARYAFMPNQLRYCGGDSNAELFNYVAAGQSDQGLKEMLEEFATMYPYLRLIAEANKIIDPFDYRVVEAYWLGNDLLENVSMKNFYRYLIDEQQLKKKFKPKLLENVFGKINLGAKPHHSWHVFNIPKRTGHYPVAHTLETMDQCRIGWGKVLAESDKITNSKKDKLTKKVFIEYEPLVIINNKLCLGPTQKKEIWLEIKNKSFIHDFKPGDWVSVHWGWACDKISPSQLQNLRKWTEYNLKIANSTREASF